MELISTRPFGAVVADNQYAPLGLMLLGTLARLNKIIMPLQRKPEVLVPVVAQKKVSMIEDIGEPVMRETQLDLENKEEPKAEHEKLDTKSKKVARPTDNTTSKPPKKKRKKGNAIDDLFSGLV